MKLIGLGGTDASGKDTVGEMLVDRFNWQVVSVSDILRAELNKRGTELNRKNLRLLSSEWRRESGLGVLVDKAVELFDKQRYKGLVISSLRNYGEADEVHKLKGKVVWVDADPQIRYERVVSRNRGTEDQVSFEEFLAEEQEQMFHYRGDQHTLNLSGVKDRADVSLINDGDDIEEFKNQVQKALGL
ncbi:AAA family ATPase [Candidatus Saccharibacteria bacterium]|nr:AAA family ATPase [Candidatus Saccharibacteria bacterium]